MRTALGFRTHSGWAAVVAIGLSPEGPVVCDRRMIVLADAETPGSKQPYHTAEPMPLPKAKEFLKQCVDCTNLLAVESIRAIMLTLKEKGHDVAGCGILASSGRVPDSVEAILASHAAIHSAEGEMYRAAIVYACGVCNLPFTRVRERDALKVAAETLHMPPKKVGTTIAALAKTVGTPWAEDQKLAALSAWTALANTSAKKNKAAGQKA